MQPHQVETVYHAAAYKHVPLVEDNVIEGILNNVFGTLACANAAIEASVKNFTLISTDKAVRPTNIMGANKRMAELVLQTLADKTVQPFYHGTFLECLRLFRISRFAIQKTDPRRWTSNGNSP